MSCAVAGGVSVAGFRLPSEQSISRNESAWIDFLRLVSCDSDPAPTLLLVQAMRRAIELEGRNIRTAGLASALP
jgi:hypothetical protein